MSDHLILGVDPGRTGALAFLEPDGTLVDVVDMPDAKGAALGAHLADLLDDFAPFEVAVAHVEEVESRPGQGHVGPFRQGENFGAICAVLGARRIPVVLHRPNAWKKAMRVTKDKASSRQKAVELWPGESERFRLVKHDGRAEAALIAKYGIEGPR